jgi:uncharacterized protein (UPF0371 family)
MSSEIFDNNRYYKAQMSAFLEKISYGDQQVIEFGGKPFGDYHASRVLPGYDPDIKARILSELVDELDDVTIAMTLHTQDVLLAPNGRRIKRRIRGDSGLDYDEEVIRLIEQGREMFGLPISTVVLAAVPNNLSAENEDYLCIYKERLESEDITIKTINSIDKYPYLEVDNISDHLTQNEPVSKTNHLIIISPGGGSGKFGVAVTEIAHKLKSGNNPNFIKFETFPVFKLPVEHPLNIAFLAATADLPNELATTNSGKTNYDKDIQNLAILKALMSHYPKLISPLCDFVEPTDMGVNMIETGIVNNSLVEAACLDEIIRRINRYKGEFLKGHESIETVDRTIKYRQELGNHAIKKEIII